MCSFHKKMFCHVTWHLFRLEIKKDFSSQNTYYMGINKGVVNESIVNRVSQKTCVGYTESWSKWNSFCNLHGTVFPVIVIRLFFLCSEGLAVTSIERFIYFLSELVV